MEQLFRKDADDGAFGDLIMDLGISGGKMKQAIQPLAGEDV